MLFALVSCWRSRGFGGEWKKNAMANSGKGPILSPTAATVVAGVIALGWIVSVTADIVSDSYEVSLHIHLLMMGVAGAAFGHGFLKNGKA